ncbi:hypothetical protein [Pseudonocardia sediminis]|nr:hypothetical protein [Pseudonocardia sediminis]
MAADVEVAGERLGLERVGTRTPDDRDERYVHAQLAPGVGGVNAIGDLLVGVVYVASWAPSRVESQEITRELRRILLSYRDGGSHKGIAIHRITESSAPAPFPITDEDDRRTEGGYLIRLRPHWDKPTVYP